LNIIHFIITITNKMADVTKNDELIDDNLNNIDSETTEQREKNDSEEILKKDFI